VDEALTIPELIEGAGPKDMVIVGAAPVFLVLSGGDAAISPLKYELLKFAGVVRVKFPMRKSESIASANGLLASV
jgi:hypothetical protein